MAPRPTRRRRPHPTRLGSGAAAAVAAVAVCLALAACGSQLSPETVARAQDGSATGVTSTGQDSGSDTGTGPGTTTDGTGPGTTTDGTGPGTTTDGTGPGTTTGTGPGTGPGTTSSDAPSNAPASQAPTGTTKAGSCAGFQNQTGITDSTITIANASDLGGAVPGLFQAAEDGTQAYVNYFNATQKLCGRSLKVLSLDSHEDSSDDQAAYTKACTDSFAAVGSVSSFDQGGAATAQGCGLPDLRAFIVSPNRQACTTCFASYAISSDEVASSIPQYWLQKQPTASQHVGIYYVDVQAAQVNAESFKAAYDKAGMKVVDLTGIPETAFNFTSYVQQMKDDGLQFIQYFGPYQFAIKLQQAMQQQDYKPTVWFEDPTIYDADYVSQVGSAAQNVYVYTPTELFSDTSNKEIQLYLTYLAQVDPNAKPNYYGLYAWSATRLFVEQATALGGKLTRASLVAALKGVKDWTDNGAHAPMSVGSKTTSPCAKIIQLTGTTWKQVSPGDFMCKGLIATGVGG